MITTQGYWTEGTVDASGTNRGGGTFVQGIPPATYSRLPAPTPAPTMPTITPTTQVDPAPVFNETDTRNAAIAQHEQQLGATENLYNSRIATMRASEEELGKKDLARANTISAITGMAGGVDATTRAGASERNTADRIQQKTDAINSQKASAISGIFDKIDANVQREKEIAATNARTDRTAAVAQMNKDAQSNIMEFATHGVDFNTAMNSSPEFKAEVARSGKTSFEIQKLYNDSLPANMKPKELFSGFKGNDFITIMQNADGTTTTSKHSAAELGIPKTADVQTITADGNVYWYDKNNPYKSDGSLNLQKIGAKTSPSTTPLPKGAPKGTTSNDISEGAGMLTNVGANGGYANPYLYRDMFDHWTKNGGGSRDAFIKAYPPKQYINPDHAALKDSSGEYVLPAFLRPATTKSTSTEQVP